MRSLTYGALYEGHESFRLFLVGNVYEDNFEKRVLAKKRNLKVKKTINRKRRFLYNGLFLEV